MKTTDKMHRRYYMEVRRCGKNKMFFTQENKIHIFKPPCNFLSSSISLFVRMWKICHSGSKCGFVWVLWVIGSYLWSIGGWRTVTLTTLLTHFLFLNYIKNRFHVNIRQFSNWSQKTPKCVKTISNTLGCCLMCFVIYLVNKHMIEWCLLIK